MRQTSDRRLARTLAVPILMFPNVPVWRLAAPLHSQTDQPTPIMLLLGPDSTCDVCMESYVDDAGIPHAISCGHVFCRT